MNGRGQAILAFSKIKANAAFPQQRPPAKWLFWLEAVEDSARREYRQ
jgi:hypothetical protein